MRTECRNGLRKSDRTRARRVAGRADGGPGRAPSIPASRASAESAARRSRGACQPPRARCRRRSRPAEERRRGAPGAPAEGTGRRRMAGRTRSICRRNSPRSCRTQARRRAPPATVLSPPSACWRASRRRDRCAACSRAPGSIPRVSAKRSKKCARAARPMRRRPSRTGKSLKKYARDLTEEARQGKLDPVIGRDDEIRRTIQVLARRTKNNPGADRRTRSGENRRRRGSGATCSPPATCPRG